MAFSGTWQVYAQENYEEFLKALGKCQVTSETISLICNTCFAWHLLLQYFYVLGFFFLLLVWQTAPYQVSLLHLI